MHRVLIIISAAQQAQANAAAQQLPGAKAADALTFTVPLNPSGLPSDPPTHYWASAVLDDAGWAAVQGFEPSFPGSSVLEWDAVADPGFPDATLADLGLKRIVPAGMGA